MDHQKIRISREGIELNSPTISPRIENFQPRNLPGVILEVVPDEKSCSPVKRNPVDKSLLDKVAVYKSLLQKAVRRMNLGEGLKAFDWLWTNDRTSLFRRITIISLEDGFYNPSWNKFWIWLMLLDSRGYDFNDSIRLEMRNQIKELITHPLYSRRREVEESVRNLTYMNNPDLIPLVIRKEYGGMPGDMRMIQNFLETYTPKPELHSLPLIHPTDGPLFEACDFHVFPWLAKTDDQRTLFWEARSSINLRDRSTFTRATESNSLIREYDELCRRLYKSTIG